MGQKNAEAVSQFHQHKLNQAWAELLGTPEGRMIMDALLQQTGAFQSSYTGDTHASAYIEGRRSIGLELFSQYLAPQGSEVHCMMLREAEDKALEIQVAAQSHEPGEDDE